jgi:hypothetical protein
MTALRTGPASTGRVPRTTAPAPKPDVRQAHPPGISERGRLHGSKRSGHRSRPGQSRAPPWNGWAAAIRASRQNRRADTAIQLRCEAMAEYGVPPSPVNYGNGGQSPPSESRSGPARSRATRGWIREVVANTTVSTTSYVTDCRMWCGIRRSLASPRTRSGRHSDWWRHARMLVTSGAGTDAAE